MIYAVMEDSKKNEEDRMSEEDMSKMLFKEEILKNQIEHFIVCG